MLSFFYCGSVVTPNVLELLLTSTFHTFQYQFITLRHPDTFSENLKIYLKNVFYYNVSDFECIFCHYRHLGTNYSLNMSRFHQIYDFMTLHHPGTFKVKDWQRMPNIAKDHQRSLKIVGDLWRYLSIFVKLWQSLKCNRVLLTVVAWNASHKTSSVHKTLLQQ